MDAALALGLAREELQDVLERGRRRPGNSRARLAAEFADARSESPCESISRVQLARLGFPKPELQFQIVRNGRVIARSDFGWPEHGLVGEADGKVKYEALLRPGQSTADAVMAEKRREAEIRAAGFWLVRWGWEEAHQPAVLRRLVGRAFELAPSLLAS